MAILSSIMTNLGVGIALTVPKIINLSRRLSSRSSPNFEDHFSLFMTYYFPNLYPMEHSAQIL